jgi:hypothetical protein
MNTSLQNDLDFHTNHCDGLPRDGILRGPLREAQTLLRRLLREAEGLLRSQIDALVYDLYALTPAEIQIVEGAAK